MMTKTAYYAVQAIQTILLDDSQWFLFCLQVHKTSSLQYKVSPKSPHNSCIIPTIDNFLVVKYDYETTLTHSFVSK